MADLLYTTVASGQAVSGAFALERPDRVLVVAIPSLSAATEVRLAFSATSGGPFFPVMRDDGTGMPYTVHSGTGPAYGLVRHCPSPWAQFSLTGSQTDNRTLTVFVSKRH